MAAEIHRTSFPGWKKDENGARPNAARRAQAIETPENCWRFGAWQKTRWPRSIPRVKPTLDIASRLRRESNHRILPDKSVLLGRCPIATLYDHGPPSSPASRR
jgi:hypothetical protein